MTTLDMLSRFQIVENILLPNLQIKKNDHTITHNHCWHFGEWVSRARLTQMGEVNTLTQKYQKIQIWPSLSWKVRRSWSHRDVSPQKLHICPKSVIKGNALKLACTFCCSITPRHRTGWLGIKHQVTQSVAWSTISCKRCTQTDLEQNVFLFFCYFLSVLFFWGVEGVGTGMQSILHRRFGQCCYGQGVNCETWNNLQIWQWNSLSLWAYNYVFRAEIQPSSCQTGLATCNVCSKLHIIIIYLSTIR